MVNALVATYDENSAKQRQGLEECMVALNKAVEGDLNARLDTMTQVHIPQYFLPPSPRGAVPMGVSLGARTDMPKGKNSHKSLPSLDRRNVGSLLLLIFINIWRDNVGSDPTFVGV